MARDGAPSIETAARRWPSAVFEKWTLDPSVVFISEGMLSAIAAFPAPWTRMTPVSDWRTRYSPAEKFSPASSNENGTFTCMPLPLVAADARQLSDNALTAPTSFNVFILNLLSVAEICHRGS